MSFLMQIRCRFNAHLSWDCEKYKEAFVSSLNLKKVINVCIHSSYTNILSYIVQCT